MELRNDVETLKQQHQCLPKTNGQKESPLSRTVVKQLMDCSSGGTVCYSCAASACFPPAGAEKTKQMDGRNKELCTLKQKIHKWHGTSTESLN